jgi:hypothetical protein
MKLYMNNLSFDINSTKIACICLISAIILIILFIISPLSNFRMTSFVMKLITLVLLGYTIYLNNKQIVALKSTTSESDQIISQVNINILCSYVFTLFIGLLFFYTSKSFL